MTKNKNIKWKSFKEAREWARDSEVNSETQWRKFRKKSNFPSDIPTNPNREYAGKGWINWADFLDTKNFKYSEIDRKSYKQAQEWAIKEGIKLQKDWRQRVKQPDFPHDVYKSPDTQYKEFTTWANFLGNNSRSSNKRINKRSYNQAREWARSVPVISKLHWEYLAKKNSIPLDIPTNLNQVYKEFSGWGDFLGFEVKGKSSIKETVLAIELSHLFKIEQQSLITFGVSQKYCDIVCPNKRLIIEYDGSYWHSKTKSKIINDIEETKLFKNYGWNILRVRETPLKKISKNDLIVPKSAAEIEVCLLTVNHLIEIGVLNNKRERSKAKKYLKNEKFAVLKNDITKLTWLKFEDAHKYVLSLKIKSESQWRKIRNDLPNNIPKNPNEVYFYSWISWPHWLRNEK